MRRKLALTAWCASNQSDKSEPELLQKCLSKKLELKNSLMKTLYRNSCNLMYASIKSFYGLNPINESLVDFPLHFGFSETMLSLFLNVRSYCGLSWNDMTVRDSSGWVVGQRRGGCTDCPLSPPRLGYTPAHPQEILKCIFWKKSLVWSKLVSVFLIQYSNVSILKDS